jgi:predicted metal-dependent hydrolase
MTQIPEPQLDPEERAALERGVREFNEGFFFECHDTLEEMWSGLRGPSRDFFQGLIQVAVAFYHLTGGNRAGAASMLSRALKRFEKYPERYAGFELGAHRAELRAWQARLAEDAPLEADLARLPKWSFAPPAELQPS